MGFGRNTEETPSRASLTEALLEHPVILEVGPLTLELAKSSSLDSIWNLTNVILGAGKDSQTNLFTSSSPFLRILFLNRPPDVARGF